MMISEVEQSEENLKNIAKKKEEHIGIGEIFICFLLSVMKVPVALHQLAIIYLAPKVPFVCFNNIGSVNASEICSTVDKNGATSRCDHWNFDRSIFPETITSEFELVCDRSHYVNIAQASFMFGVLVGNIGFGIAADSVGRKTPLMVAVVFQVITGILCAFSRTFWMLVILRFLLAVTVGGVMTISFVLCMEMVEGNWRSVVGICSQIPFSIGHILLGVVAYFVPHWRYFQISISVPSIIFFTYYWIIPESPKWLQTTGINIEDSKISKGSINDIREEFSNDIEMFPMNTDNYDMGRPTEVKVKTAQKLIGMIRTGNIRKKTIILSLCWLVNGMILYGLAQYVSQIQGNIFLNVILSGTITIPGTLLSLYLIEKFGRRNTLIFSQTSTSIFCLLLILLIQGYSELRIIFVLISVMSLSVSFPTLYVFTVELYPTAIRNIGLGSCSMFARIGSMISPFISSSSVRSKVYTPLVFGVCSLLAAMVCCFLPETQGCKLPQTLEDGEDFGKRKNTEVNVKGLANKGYEEDQKPV